jgi:hypothetical protein
MSSLRTSLIASSLVAGSLVFGIGTASADALFAQTPAVHLAVQTGVNQAQLADMLRAKGYSEIKLSAVPADLQNPHPELNPSLTAHPETVAARGGWNGVATKDGQQVQVYLDN